MPHEDPRDVEAHGNMRQDNETVVDEQDDDVEGHGLGRQDNETVVDEQADDVEAHARVWETTTRPSSTSRPRTSRRTAA